MKKENKKILFVLIPVIVFLLFALFGILQFLSPGGGSSGASYLTAPDAVVAEGDSVHIDYTGYIDGAPFEGGSTQGAGATLIIGSGSYVEGFEEQLIGAHPGDTVRVTVTFPDDYSSLALRGEEAVFEVTVNGIFR